MAEEQQGSVLVGQTKKTITLLQGKKIQQEQELAKSIKISNSKFKREIFSQTGMVFKTTFKTTTDSPRKVSERYATKGNKTTQPTQPKRTNPKQKDVEKTLGDESGSAEPSRGHDELSIQNGDPSDISNQPSQGCNWRALQKLKDLAVLAENPD